MGKAARIKYDKDTEEEVRKEERIHGKKRGTASIKKNTASIKKNKS